CSCRTHAGTGAPRIRTARSRSAVCALDVLEVLDRLALPDARAVGFSLGAKTLLHVATERPDRVRRMVLASVAPRFPDTTRALFRQAALREPAPEEWALLRSRHVHGEAQIRALLRLPARFADDPTDMSFSAAQLAAITAPTLIVAGEQDGLYPLELACEVHR